MMADTSPPLTSFDRTTANEAPGPLPPCARSEPARERDRLADVVNILNDCVVEARGLRPSAGRNTSVDSVGGSICGNA